MDVHQRRVLSFLDGDDETFDNYTETTTDPGDALLITASIICASSLLGLPLLAKLGRYLSTQKCGHDIGVHREGRIREDGAISPSSSHTERSHLPPIERGTHEGENVDKRRGIVLRGIDREARESIRHHQQATSVEVVLSSSVEIASDLNRHEIGVESLEVYQSENQTTRHHVSLCSTDYFAKRVKFMWKIAKCDNETKRLLRLAIPFTCSAMIETVSDLVILVIIAQYIGTDSSVAYAMVDLLVGISSEFNGGWIEAVSSLCSQAYGTSNYELAGEMVQASCIAYVLGELIFASIWLNLIDTIIRLMGFDETVVTLAKEYVPVQISLNIIMGITETILDFLEVVEKEKFANTLYCLSSTLEVGLVATFAIKADANLTTVGLLMLACESLLLFLCILIPSQMGWLRRFEFGLFNKCSLRNITMLKQLFKVALPLAFGSVLAYAEWEFLTFFAAALGPAEAATWAILGFVWDVFESTTEAIGDASEVRCAYQLGKGRPELAKISAYKSTFLSSIVAMVVTTIFLGLSDYLPSWLTQDQTIQNMLSELFPLMALGNITMNMGMVCWAVIGAQGRYRLSTCVAFACSFFITIPLGAIFTLWLEVNLQGLTFAVVVGYTMTAMLLSTILLISDWEMLATQIQEKMRAEEDSVDSDSSSSSSSSSSRHSHIEDRSSHALAQSNVITGDTSEISIAMRDEVSPLPKTTGSLDLVRTPPRKNKDTGPQPHQSPESVSDLSFDSTLVSRDSTTRPMIGPSPTVLDEEQASSIENDNIVDSCQHESSFDLDGSPVSRTWNSSTTSQRSQRTPGSPHTRRAHQPPHVGSPDHSTSVNDNSLNSWPHNDMIGESRVVKGRRKRIG